LPRRERESIMILGGSGNPNSMGKACTVADIQTQSLKYSYRIMIDDGMEFQQEPTDDEPKRERFNNSISPNLSRINGRKIDAVLLTHFHYDHVGALGELVKIKYNPELNKTEIESSLKPEASIFSTPQTACGLEYTLRDGEMSSREHTVLNTIELLRRRKIIPKPGVYEILPDLPVFFHPVGHLPGASSIIIPTASGGKGLITGDMCRENMPTIKGWQLPSECWPADWTPDQIWGCDLTYGTGTKPPLSEEVEKFQVQAKADLINGKKIVGASFRTGRGQNLPMWLLPVAKELGIPIWIDGSISKIYNIFQKYRWSDSDGELPELGELTGIKKVRDSMHRRALLEEGGPAIFFTTSGMGNFGPIVDYFKHGLPREDFSFYFTSWLAPGSNGDRLLKQYKEALQLRQKNPLKLPRAKILDAREKEGSIVLPFKADVHHFKLGAHGDLNDFVDFVEDIVTKCRKGRLLKRIILTHGNFKSLTEGANALSRFTEEICYGNEGTIVNI
jgi:Cft2 family RNA processing exonuclease